MVASEEEDSEAASSGGGDSQEAGPGKQPLQDEDFQGPLVVDDELALDLGAYVLSVQNKSGFRRLHRIGACWRKPGVDYENFRVLGFDLPPASAYDAVCKGCFSGGAPAEEAGEASSGSSSSSG